MSGHSKWSTIKHKKAAQDSKRGKIFGQISRMIRVAVKEGKSGEPSQNPTLRLALEKAKAVNMPKANIDRAIEKGLGKSKSGSTIDEVIYEGFGPMGVGLMIVVVTDNRNRTGAEVRSILERAGGSLGSPGSVGYMFDRVNQDEVKVRVPMPIETESERQAVERLIETLEGHDDVEMVVTNMV